MCDPVSISIGTAILGSGAGAGATAAVGASVLATGVGHTVRDFCDAAFSHAGLDWKDYVKYNDGFERPSEVDALIGDSSRALEVLGWKAQTTALDLARLMVDSDRQDVERLLDR